MVTTRLVAAWLLFVGIVWLLIAAWVMLVMSGISTPAVAVWLLLVMYFGGPIVLIIGSGFVIARRYSRVGTVLSFLACGWLTWIIGAITPYDWLYIALAFIVIISDAAVIVMLRTPQPSNKAMQRAAPRSDA